MNKRKTFIKLFGFLFFFLMLPAVLGITAYALTVTDGIYTNIYGWHGGQTNDCKPSSANNFCLDEVTYTGKDCDLKSGKCSGGGGSVVYKFICNGKHEECAGNGPAPISSKGPHGGTLDVFSGVSCNQTVQLDVFDRNCDTEGWDNCKLTDYIVWYSGACPQQPAPACDTNCASNPDICDQAGGGCTYCDTGGSGTCQPPPSDSSPDPSPPAACGSSCQDSSDCTQDPSNTCTYCNPNTNKCETPPGTSPPPSGPACGQSCGPGNNTCAQATDGCTTCNLTTGTCTPPSQPPGTSPPPSGPSVTPPPTPTPTPDFNTGMCKCDGFQSSPILAGQNATFSSFAKVEGEDVSKARVDNISFRLMESAKGATTGTVIERSGNLEAKVVEESPNKVRYQSDWTVRIPQNVDPNKSYRVFADIDCQRKTQANAGTQAVLAAEDASATPSFFGQILNMIKSWFGADNTQESQEPAGSGEEASILQEQIRLGNVKPANVTLNACNALYFEFPGLQEE